MAKEQEHEETKVGSQRENRQVKCNALYKTARNLNCYLTASQAIEVARRLLEKAQLILDNEIEGTAVQMWNTGKDNEKLYFGLIQARKGGRRKRARAPEA